MASRLIALVGLALAQIAASPHATASTPVTAVWKERTLSFSYSSAHTVYSCDALASRVASILRALGARDDIKVRASNCSNSFVPASPHMDDVASWDSPASASSRVASRQASTKPMASVYVQLRVPVEVTPDVLAELERDKKRRELVSRVTGDPSARFDDPVAFTAQRENVTLSHKTIGIEPEECELLEQISGSTFRKLGVRVVRHAGYCDPGSDSRLPPEYVVEALVPVRYEPVDPGSTPPEPQQDADPAVIPPPASVPVTPAPRGDESSQ